MFPHAGITPEWYEELWWWLQFHAQDLAYGALITAAFVLWIVVICIFNDRRA